MIMMVNGFELHHACSVTQGANKSSHAASLKGQVHSYNVLGWRYVATQVTRVNDGRSMTFLTQSIFKRQYCCCCGGGCGCCATS